MATTIILKYGSEQTIFMHLKLLAQLLAASLVTSGQLLTLVIFFVLSLPPKIRKGLQI